MQFPTSCFGGSYAGPRDLTRQRLLCKVMAQVRRFAGGEQSDAKSAGVLTCR